MEMKSSLDVRKSIEKLSTDFQKKTIYAVYEKLKKLEVEYEGRDELPEFGLAISLMTAELTEKMLLMLNEKLKEGPVQ